MTFSSESKSVGISGNTFLFDTMGAIFGIILTTSKTICSVLLLLFTFIQFETSFLKWDGSLLLYVLVGSRFLSGVYIRLHSDVHVYSFRNLGR